MPKVPSVDKHFALQKHNPKASRMVLKTSLTMPHRESIWIFVDETNYVCIMSQMYNSIGA